MATDKTPCWFTSSYSSNGGNCVEVATNLAPSHGTIPVRDTKDPNGPVIDLPAPAFTAFVDGLKGGGFEAV